MEEGMGKLRIRVRTPGFAQTVPKAFAEGTDVEHAPTQISQTKTRRASRRQRCCLSFVKRGR